jgi:excisionase family DNA binding protein
MSIPNPDRESGLPLAVKPKKACQLLDCGNTRLYELLAQGELVSFKDGNSRKILVTSIRDYIDRRVAAAKGQ